MQREMGGPPGTRANTDFNSCLSDLAISDRYDDDDRDNRCSRTSLAYSPHSSSPVVEFSPTLDSVCSDASIPLSDSLTTPSTATSSTISARRSVSLESHSGLFSIDAKSGLLYVDETTHEPARRTSRSFPPVSKGADVPHCNCHSECVDSTM